MGPGELKKDSLPVKNLKKPKKKKLKNKQAKGDKIKKIEEKIDTIHNIRTLEASQIYKSDSTQAKDLKAKFTSANQSQNQINNIQPETERKNNKEIFQS